LIWAERRCWRRCFINHRRSDERSVIGSYWLFSSGE
jgi:hypothetical protein